MKKRKILVIAAHPDDEALGCGGIIKKYTRAGDKVYCLILGGGKSSRVGKKEKNIKDEQVLLAREAQAAAKILGISQTILLDFPDQKYDSVPFLHLVQAIERIKKQIRPTIIYTHYKEDLNLDHRLTFNAVMTACRPLKNETVKEIYSFEVLSSTEWSPKKKTTFTPNVFVDIADVLKFKIKALEAYKSELRDNLHPRSLAGVRILSGWRGLIVGKKACEAFELIRKIQ